MLQWSLAASPLLKGRTDPSAYSDSSRTNGRDIQATRGNPMDVQSGPFVRDVDGDSTRAIERFHGSLKDRIKVFRGFQDRDTSDILTQGWLFYYNFMRGLREACEDDGKKEGAD